MSKTYHETGLERGSMQLCWRVCMMRDGTAPWKVRPSARLQMSQVLRHRPGSKLSPK